MGDTGGSTREARRQVVDTHMSIVVDTHMSIVVDIALSRMSIHFVRSGYVELTCSRTLQRHGSGPCATGSFRRRERRTQPTPA